MARLVRDTRADRVRRETKHWHRQRGTGSADRTPRATPRAPAADHYARCWLKSDHRIVYGRVRLRRVNASVKGAATATTLVRQPRGSGRQHPAQDTLVPFDVVAEYLGIGAMRNCPRRDGDMVFLSGCSRYECWSTRMGPLGIRGSPVGEPYAVGLRRLSIRRMPHHSALAEETVTRVGQASWLSRLPALARPRAII